MRHNSSSSVGVVFGRRVRAVRQSLGLSQQDVANRLVALGVDLKRYEIAKLETQPARAAKVRLEDALAIALVLGVEPAALLAPEGHTQPVALAPGFETSAGSLRTWLAGGWPLRGDDEKRRRRFFTEGLDSEVLEARADEARKLGGYAAPLPAPLFEALAEVDSWGHNGDTHP